MGYFLHFLSAEIEEAFDEVSVDESCHLLRLSLRVERPPEVVFYLAHALDHLRELVLYLSQVTEEILRELADKTCLEKEKVTISIR